MAVPVVSRTPNRAHREGRVMLPERSNLQEPQQQPWRSPVTARAMRACIQFDVSSRFLSLFIKNCTVLPIPVKTVVGLQVAVDKISYELRTCFLDRAGAVSPEARLPAPGFETACLRGAAVFGFAAHVVAGG